MSQSHSKRLLLEPIVAWENGYPGSGGAPNTSRPRAIFTTIVQLEKPIATKVLLPDPVSLCPGLYRGNYELSQYIYV